jgi:4-hydroxy 2-oxovalerate aldolase
LLTHKDYQWHHPNIQHLYSQNSLQLSFSNTKTLLGMNIERSLIIDSCLYGMGRGAGNLCTELITKYLNDNWQTDYKISQLLRTIDNILKPIYDKKPWG